MPCKGTDPTLELMTVDGQVLRTLKSCKINVLMKQIADGRVGLEKDVDFFLFHTRNWFFTPPNPDTAKLPAPCPLPPIQANTLVENKETLCPKRLSKWVW